MPFDYDLQAKVALSDAFLVHYRAAAIEPISAVRLQLANARRWPGAAAGVPSKSVTSTVEVGKAWCQLCALREHASYQV